MKKKKLGRMELKEKIYYAILGKAFHCSGFSFLLRFLFLFTHVVFSVGKIPDFLKNFFKRDNFFQ
jgi:hypothetical protein